MLSPPTSVVAIVPRRFRGLPVVLDHELAVLLGTTSARLQDLLGYQGRHFPLGSAFFLSVWEVGRLWPDQEDRPSPPHGSVAVFTDCAWPIVIRLLANDREERSADKMAVSAPQGQGVGREDAESVFGIAPLLGATLSLRPDPPRRGPQ